jgi:excisionase family DNA binding protein
MKTYGLEAAADFLHVHTNTVLRLAASCQLRGAKIGRAWVFTENDLADYLQAEIERQTRERARRMVAA